MMQFTQGTTVIKAGLIDDFLRLPSYRYNSELTNSLLDGLDGVCSSLPSKILLSPLAEVVRLPAPHTSQPVLPPIRQSSTN